MGLTCFETTVWRTQILNLASRPWLKRGASVAASKHAGIRVWGPHSGPTEPRLFEPKASLRGGPDGEYWRWLPEGPAIIALRLGQGMLAVATPSDLLTTVSKQKNGPKGRFL